MRSSRALRSLQAAARIPSYRIPSISQNLRKSYCTVCDEANSPAAKKHKLPKTSKDLVTPPADHRQLGIDQELFTTSIYSPGSPLFLPNGTKIFNKLTAFLRAQYDLFGFEEVITPTIYKKSLWEKSGHWENYAEDMYSVTGRGASGDAEGKQVGEDEEYGLKPMNCPGHCLLFASKKRSYKDLPIRFADFSPLHRNEVSGSLSGLTRVRRFHQDDGHIFCRPSQIREEISKTLQFIKLTYETLRLGSYRLTLSTRPKSHYIGTVEEWDNAEAALTGSLDASGEAWTVNEGDGAFYGPKIDIILKDSDGKEHQTATIQLDFQLPKRFELEYTAPAPELEAMGKTTKDRALNDVQGPVTPVLIHRAVLGSVERIMALLIEHYNGRWPFWLHPRQIILLPISNTKPFMDYTQNLKNILHGRSSSHTRSAQTSVPWLPSQISMNNRLSVDVDADAKSLGKRISTAKRKGYAVIVIIGNESLEHDQVTVDLTGIHDPKHRLLNHRAVKNSAYRDGDVKVLHFDKTATQSGEQSAISADDLLMEGFASSSQEDPAYSFEDELPEMSFDKIRGAINLDVGDLPPISVEDLKQVKMGPRTLRGTLVGLQNAYF